MKSFKLLIEYQCPQCGAPATLTETDRLFTCEFCRVNSYLLPGDYFRYVLPMKVPEGKEIIYFPYWRYKGILYSCVRSGVEEKLMNINYQAIESPHFPLSLKFRDQVLKMQFVSPKNEGSFIDPKTTHRAASKKLKERLELQASHRLYHQTHTTEAFSLIYSPYYMTDKLYDAVVNEPAEFQPDELDIDLSKAGSLQWRLKFLATLCPNCAWNLEGDRDACVLTCRNCNSAWQPEEDQFRRIESGFIPPEKKEKNIIYLPFWRIRAHVSGIDLDSYADLVKIAKLPIRIQNKWHEIPIHFWGLGFKIRSKLVPRASQMTVCQPQESVVDGIPESAELHPVTLPLGESVAVLKVMLAYIIGRRSASYRKLNEITIEPKNHLLVYVPFVKTNLELIHPTLNISFIKSQL
jgi:hypothetical protein